ncbi:DUF3306 domain-containing protein [Halomonas saccharevitans]|uniref:DUF3306 domain-containing protein n=1 Tax=Halomonas saccharevitans TaxID=416872 RepID=A0A1I6ZZ66_9GAMM|nr:DUF3306 domain-containing protein [Halomonas saccharevitans]SFT67949.1 Protein of unknown function [Halomonas saccharevitans]
MSRLERWSRLKRGDTQEAPASSASAEGEWPLEADGQDGREEDAREDDSPETLEPGSLDHTLPDPDTLPPGSDIKAYLVSGVSAGLRKRALRRLFAASHYGVRDGLDDYDDDFREKLKPLADDVAERLRQWTRQTPDDETTEDAATADSVSTETDQTDTGPIDLEQDESTDEEETTAHEGNREEADDPSYGPAPASHSDQRAPESRH